MINTEYAQYCYLNILDIYHDDKLDERKKLIRSFNVLKEFLLKLDEDNAQLFSSFFQRLHFIITKYQLKKNISGKLHSLRYFSGKISHDKSIAITGYDLDLRLCDIFIVINQISGADFPKNVPFLREEVRNENRSKFYEKLPKQVGQKVKFLRAIVGSVDSCDSVSKILEITAKNEHYEDIKIQLKETWFAHQNMYPEGSVIHLIDVGFDGKTYYTHDQSLVSLEPDYLIDVTDIAECFGIGEANPNLYFLSKYQKGTVAEAAIVGNLVNHIFDELIFDPEADFDSAFERGLNIKPIQIIGLLVAGADLQSIRERVAKQYHNLKFAIAGFKTGIKNVEPSFISARYGMQGRLDLLLDNGKSKYVVELKSGKSPTRDIMYNDIDGRRYTLSIWKNHVVQAICYNMLLESAYEESAVTSSILYSSAELNFLRNVPNINQLKKEVLKCRNYIVAVERALAKDNFSIFRKFNIGSFGNHPSYKVKSIDDFSINYNGFSDLERDYFHSFTGYISREIYSRKIGQSLQNRGFASLWLDTTEEKEDNYAILRHLKLERSRSDFDKMHLCFSIVRSNGASAFRKGDICLVYHIPENGKFDVLSGQLLKGSIRRLNSEEIVVSFRNKLNNFDFSADYEWALEPDSIDSLNKQLFSSLYSLMNIEKSKREMILGLAEPKQLNIKKEFYPELNQAQIDLLYKALSAKDYFLLQGPPGTGKTSFMLRYMVKYLFDNTDENVLLLAYTNRAADEICSSLKRIDSKFPFLRLGGKDSTDYPENLVAFISESENISSIYHLINDTRIFVSTVASALTTQEILKIKNFSTVIIDEASQISEPYLPTILTSVGRFILIGDEKQLPAVVTQPSSMLRTSSEALAEIGLSNLGASYFERMLANAKQRNWQNCYGMLTHQARMNESIMNLANFLFYDNKLMLANTHPSPKVFPETTEWLKLLSGNDIIFVDTPVGSQSKVNGFEAEVAVSIANDLQAGMGAEFDSSTLGIITPFRAQVAEIYRMLGSELQQLVTTDTVERFQGSERDIIIFSFAVNHVFDMGRILSAVEIDGTNVDRKLNVALTRAKHKLILLGNMEILKSSEIHRNMIEYIEENHLVVKKSEL